MDEDQRVVYQQDCESFRYQDKLLWSRFQTLSAIEGAVVWALLYSSISGVSSIVIAFAATIVVFLFCVIAYKDYKDSKLFIDRVSEFEKNVSVNPIKPKRVLGMNARVAILVIFTILLMFNLYLIVHAFGVISP